MNRTPAAALALAALFGSCSASTAGSGAVADHSAPVDFRPRARASTRFWKHWGDGKAELSGYRLTTERYGQLRQGTAVLIYVTEPMDRRTWIKDDGNRAPAEQRVNVLKLNHMLYFRTGIYPYSVMTSTFAPVDGMVDRERFAPVKIAMSAQEWCGHVYHQIQARPRWLRSVLHSYFGGEGDRQRTVETARGTLYDDALLIQLRELDGPFNGGKRWSGSLVPSLWSVRKKHQPLRPLRAVIERSQATLEDGRSVTRFVLRAAGHATTFDVERELPRRILRVTDDRGQQMTLLKTARLPYWQLNHLGEERYLEALGLNPSGTAAP